MSYVDDKKARSDALDPLQSVIVQAPAGSGKTTLLVKRYLTLLATVARVPESILAMTFTKKAAAEMRSRVMKILQQGAEGTLLDQEFASLAQSLLTRSSQKGWHLLEKPERLSIQTIDSFCAEIYSRSVSKGWGEAPMRFQDISPDPAALYTLAARRFLERLETDDVYQTDLKKLLWHVDNDLNKICDLLVTILEKREQWIYYLYPLRNLQDKKQLLERSLQEVVRDHLQRFPHVLNESIQQEVLELLHYARENQNKGDCTLIHWPGTDLKDLSSWLTIADLLLTKEGGLRKTVTERDGFPAPSSCKHTAMKAHFKLMKERFLVLVENLKQHLDFTQYLTSLRELPETSYSESSWQVLTALLNLLPLLLAELKLVFQQEQQADFSEVSLNALNALGTPENPTPLALYLDHQIDHILVDEFQDTSILQFELLQQLVAGWQFPTQKTLFLVGDPMQSIYRFRKAEVGLFLKAGSRGVADVSLKPLLLSRNFRSDPQLVTWINQVMAEVFPVENNMDLGEITYTPSVGVNGKLTSSTTCWWLDSDDPYLEALQIAEIIQEAKKKNTQQKIAVLVQARRHIHALLPILNQWNIDFNALEIAPLASDPLVSDLANMTLALLDLSDRTAWLALLRAPWCGLTLADLESLVNQDINQSLWEALQGLAHNEALSMEGRKRAQTVMVVMQEALASLGLKPLAAVIEQAWWCLGGEYLTQSSHGLQAAWQYIDFLYELAHVPLGELSMILEQRLSQSYLTLKSAVPFPVEIMTIHKAKGLEFDTVICPGLGRRLAPDRADLFVVSERISDQDLQQLLLAPLPAIDETDSIYQYLKSRESKKNAAERLRLFYVAVTRAKAHLHLLGHTVGEKPAPHSMMASLWPVLEAQFRENPIGIKQARNDQQEEISSNDQRVTLSFMEQWHVLHAAVTRKKQTE